MGLWQIIGLGLLFAVLAAVLFIWGLKKEEDPGSAVERRLLNAAGSKVEKYLKKHESITTAEIETLVKGTKVSAPWSRKRVQVQNAKLFTKNLLPYLLQQQIIEEVGKGSYQLRRK